MSNYLGSKTKGRSYQVSLVTGSRDSCTLPACPWIWLPAECLKILMLSRMGDCGTELNRSPTFKKLVSTLGMKHSAASAEPCRKVRSVSLQTVFVGRKCR